MKNNNVFDVIIVGSGPSGLHAAYPLIEAGLKVAIVDADQTNPDLKLKSNIKINQSFEKGGLSNLWPGICDYFSNDELEQIGLPADEINKEYRIVAKRIKLQKNLKLDPQIKSLLGKNIYQLPVAPHYKTSPVIDQFKKRKNFTYIPGILVNDIKEQNEFVIINNKISGKYLVLAAGAVNTTRILLQSFKLKGKLPFLTKVYNLVICLNIKSLYKKRLTQTNPLGQVAISQKDYFIQFYRFNPLSINKISTLLPKKLTSLIFSGLGPHLVIADVRFNTIVNPIRFYQLKEDSLEISFKYTDQELKNQLKSLSQIKGNLLSIGLLPLKVTRGDVTSHYAGGVIVPGKLSADQNGKLQQLKKVYIADASSWKMLPGKPPTLTIMANASRVGKKVLENFK